MFNRKKSSILKSTLIAVATSVCISHAFGQAQVTWIGGGSNPFNWSDTSNWTNGDATDYGTLTFAGSNGTTNTDDTITAQNQLLWTGTSAWTLNQGGSTVLSLYDFAGAPPEIVNQSTGLVTINLPITFAANETSPAGYSPWGEINAVNGNITFGSGATLTVNGSSVNGIMLFGSGNTTTFNNTVSASGKWFAFTGANTTVAIGGSFTSGDIYVMNNGTLDLNSGGSITIGAVRLGGDFGNTGFQDQTQGATFALTSATGGQNFGDIINTTSGNTSEALLVNSQNTSGTNTLSGNTYLDSDLFTTVASGGVLALTGSTDLKNQTLTAGGAGNTNISGVLVSSTGSGNLTYNGTGTLTLSSSNSYTGTTTVSSGQVTAQNNSALGTGGVIVSAGGKLLVDTGVTVANTITLAGTTAQYNRNVANGQGYAGMTASSNFGHFTTFSLLGGTNNSGSQETIFTSLTNTPTHDTANRASDVLSLSGNAGQTFVLQMSYNPADVSGAAYIGWYDSALGAYVNAAYGNSTPGSIDDTGELTGSWATNGSTLTLGAFGFDSADDVAWVVVDHNSEFTVIPEPGSYAMVLGGFGILIVFQRMRRFARQSGGV